MLYTAFKNYEAKVLEGGHVSTIYFLDKSCTANAKLNP